MSWVWFIQTWAASQADSGHGDSGARPAARHAARASRKVHAPPVLTLGDGAAAKETEAEQGERAAAPRAGGPVPAAVRETLRAQGQPLDAATRRQLEPRFGRSFDHVRVHADTRAAESAQAVDALAYTVGPHIVFAPGQYAPHTPHGRSLIAHELTHVVQQDSGPSIPAGAEGSIRHAPEGLESEADAAAGAAAEGRGVRAVSRLPGLALQRQKKSAPAPKPPAPKPAAPALSLLGPKVTIERTFPGKTLPPVDMGGYVATSSISLIAGATFTPAGGPFKEAMLNDKEIAVELGRLAASFTLAKKSRGPQGVTFTSTFPGFSEINSDSFAAPSANTFVYSSALGPPQSISKMYTMSGGLRVQLHVTLTPKPPVPKEKPKANAPGVAPPAPRPAPAMLDGIMAVLEIILAALLFLI